MTVGWPHGSKINKHKLQNIFFTFHCSIAPSPLWAMTVTKPKRVVLVNAPGYISHQVQEITSTWRGGQTYWSRGSEGNVGKMAISSLLRYVLHFGL